LRRYVGPALEASPHVACRKLNDDALVLDLREYMEVRFVQLRH
jgi:hypothetical protein